MPNIAQQDYVVMRVNSDQDDQVHLTEEQKAQIRRMFLRNTIFDLVIEWYDTDLGKIRRKDKVKSVECDYGLQIDFYGGGFVGFVDCGEFTPEDYQDTIPADE